jgi:hypothetical protein
MRQKGITKFYWLQVFFTEKQEFFGRKEIL